MNAPVDTGETFLHIYFLPQLEKRITLLLPWHHQESLRCISLAVYSAFCV